MTNGSMTHSRTVKIQLFIMMFLQYAIWGSWAPVLSEYLTRIGFNGLQIGFIYSLLPLATIVSPFVADNSPTVFSPFNMLSRFCSSSAAAC